VALTTVSRRVPRHAEGRVAYSVGVATRCADVKSGWSDEAIPATRSRVAGCGGQARACRLAEGVSAFVIGWGSGL